MPKLTCHDQKLGYGPGTVIYTLLSLLATYGGYMLWKMFLGLDSSRYPVKTYADLAFRIYGPVARHAVSLLQSVQLLFNVGIIILINGLSLEQVITGSGRPAVCFVLLCIVWALAGRSKSPPPFPTSRHEKQTNRATTERKKLKASLSLS